MIFSDENWEGESHGAVTQAAHKAIIKEYMRRAHAFSLLAAPQLW